MSKKALLVACLCLPLNAPAELFVLDSHTTWDSSGRILSQARRDYRAEGAFWLKNGELEVKIQIEGDGWNSNIDAKGTYSVDSSGAVVFVRYDNGVEHYGVVILGDPLVTLSCENGGCEVNAWRPANGFVRNRRVHD